MEQADKARRRCGEVFNYAIVTGRAKYNPAPDLVGAMKGLQKKHTLSYLCIAFTNSEGRWAGYGGWSYR